ncbi:hypothetical protein HYR65_00985 [Candidatus Azambacteria bacterium]|nr:hypothetical protein [Candidatus Azambacteria bacterium]
MYKTVGGVRVLDGLMDGVDLIAEIHVGCGLKREIHNLDFRHEHFDKVLSIDQQNSFW